MLAKHPQAPLPLVPCDPAPAAVSISDEDDFMALKSFPGASAPGPSSFWDTQFRLSVLCPSPDHAKHILRAFLGVVRYLCAGHVSSEIVPHLCGATLITCQKKGGGLCPIAVGKVLHCLTSKCVSRVVWTKALQNLTPLQVGVGVKAGC